MPDSHSLTENSWNPDSLRRPRSTRNSQTSFASSASCLSCVRFFEFEIAISSRNLCSRSEEHTSELQSLMRISYAVFCLKKKKKHTITDTTMTAKLKS